MNFWPTWFKILYVAGLTASLFLGVVIIVSAQDKKPEPKPIARDAYYELESAGKQVLLDRQQMQADQDKYIALFGAACDAAGVDRKVCQPSDIKPEAKK